VRRGRRGEIAGISPHAHNVRSDRKRFRFTFAWARAVENDRTTLLVLAHQTAVLKVRDQVVPSLDARIGDRAHLLTVEATPLLGVELESDGEKQDSQSATERNTVREKESNSQKKRKLTKAEEERKNKQARKEAHTHTPLPLRRDQEC
jgi:hypothetical protein